MQARYDDELEYEDYYGYQILNHQRRQNLNWRNYVHLDKEVFRNYLLDLFSHDRLALHNLNIITLGRHAQKRLRKQDNLNK